MAAAGATVYSIALKHFCDKVECKDHAFVTTSDVIGVLLPQWRDATHGRHHVLLFVDGTKMCMVNRDSARLLRWLTVITKTDTFALFDNMQWPWGSRVWGTAEGTPVEIGLPDCMEFERSAEDPDRWSYSGLSCSLFRGSVLAFCEEVCTLALEIVTRGSGHKLQLCDDGGDCSSSPQHTWERWQDAAVLMAPVLLEKYLSGKAESGGGSGGRTPLQPFVSEIRAMITSPVTGTAL